MKCCFEWTDCADNASSRFQQRILDLREKELKQLLTYMVGDSISTMLWSATPLTVALATFAAYVLSGNELDVASALTALALFDILRFPLFMLPQGTKRSLESVLIMHHFTSPLRPSQ